MNRGMSYSLYHFTSQEVMHMLFALGIFSNDKVNAVKGQIPLLLKSITDSRYLVYCGNRPC